MITVVCGFMLNVKVLLIKFINVKMLVEIMFTGTVRVAIIKH